MELGFLTNCFGKRSLAEIADWALENGFEALEVGPSIPLDEAAFREVQKKVRVAALIYCRNFFDSNEEVATKHVENLRERVEFAKKLGIPLVVTSTGMDAKSGYEGNIERVGEFFRGILELIGDSPVKIAFENCPGTGNIAISPYMWEKLFASLSDERVGLAYDPSHLVWQFIDPYEPVVRFKGRIFHVHAKDTEIMQDVLKEKGILMDHSWWRYRLPGLGAIDWKKMIGALKDAGYDGAISVEHEDPVWSGTPDKVGAGLVMAREHLVMAMA